MARHDAKRTGAASGTGDIVTPVPYWRTYLGGSVGDAVEVDLNHDKMNEILFVSGGRVVVKLPTDELVWQTPPLAIQSFVGIDDLNGDGNLDVVVNSSDHVYVLDGSTGIVEWAEPDGEMGRIGVVRMADLDGDKKPEVLVEECACCAPNSGKTGFAYSFAGGFKPAGPLFTLPFAACGSGYALTVLDADGDGKSEILASDFTTFGMLNGATGATLATSTDLGPWTSISRCQAANIDGNPGDEAICIKNIANASQDRRVLALHYEPGTTPQLTVMWSKVMAPDGGDIAFVDPIADLEGNGKLEAVVSTLDASGQWSTQILAPATGAMLVAIPNHKLLGVEPIASGSAPLLITATPTGLEAFAYTGGTTPSVTSKWTLSNRQTLSQPDYVALQRTSFGNRLVLLDVSDDMSRDLLTTIPMSGGLEAFSLVGASPSSIATIDFGDGVTASRAWVFHDATNGRDLLGVARTDGFLTTFASKLAPTNAAPDANRPGIAVGGYYSSGAWRQLQQSPVTSPLDGTKLDRVLVNDSRGALLRLDAEEATLGSPPRRSWVKQHTTAPTIVAGLDGALPGIACEGLVDPVTDPPKNLIAALHADGSTIWTSEVESTPMLDIVPGRFNGDSAPDLVFWWGQPTDLLLHTRALSSTGAVLWNADPFDPGSGRTPSGISVGDYDGDGIDDVFFQRGGTYVLNGSNGQVAKTGGPPDSYFLPTIFDVDGDGTEEITFHGGLSPAQTYRHDLTTVVWAGMQADLPYPYGAIAKCPAGPVLVEGSLANPARLKISRLSGASVGTFTTVVLAGGKAYADEATALADSAVLGQLTSASVHANLTGKARPTAVVGSAGGWLYGINPCNGQLDFAVDFGAAVGDAVFGDTDGDGLDEIVVTAADGYLYDLKNEAIKSPRFVWDIDLPHNITDRDVDDIDTVDTLWGTWGSVQGATAYEVAVLDPAGAFVSSPHWTNVGLVTTAAVHLALNNGERYTFAVRAVGSKGPSVDALSNGVTVHLPGDGGTDGGDAGVDASADSAPDVVEMDAGPSSDAPDAATVDASGPVLDASATPAVAGGGCNCRTSGPRGASDTPYLLGILLALGATCRLRQTRRSKPINTTLRGACPDE
jgi:hypothetical protein